MSDLQTDLDRGGLNWFDSGGTYDPTNCGPSGRDPWDTFPLQQQGTGTVPVNPITVLTGVALIVFILATLFAPEWLAILVR